MEALTIAVVGAMNVLCFMIGAKVGRSAAKGERIELPNPVKAVKEYREQQKVELAKDQYETIMRNIDNYNGTSNGQEDVPRG